jgi:predicted CDP-diglyceride synthetase/phosphatidate cytidylyltransferase
MSTRETVKGLEQGMIVAALIEEVEPLVRLLRADMMKNARQSMVIAMAVFIGEVVAAHPRIRESERDDQLDRLIGLIEASYARRRRGAAA